MSDIEGRLIAAGEAWRAEQATVTTKVAVSDRRRHWLPAVAAVVVVVLAVAVTALAGLRGDRPSPSPPAGPVGSWEELPPGPLSARVRPIVAGWAGAVVIVGGREDPCPPNAGCVRDPRETLRDGAVYDVRSRTWRSLPPAPVPLDVFGSAVVGDVLYLWLPADGGSPARLLALDLVQGRWESAPAPPTGDYCCLRLIAAGARLIGYSLEASGSALADYSYDPATKRWQPLPTAPFGASYDRSMVWTGTALVLVTPGPPPGRSTSTGPPYLKAAVLERDAWRVLPDQQTVISSSVDWTWTGSRVVSATTYRADGGQTNGFGRSIPAGGQLDPATGTWTELPPAPETTTVSGVVAADARYVANGEGVVLDVVQQRWLELPAQPDGADQDAGGAWAAGRLVVWGGVRWNIGSASSGGRVSYSSPRLLASGAVWTPPADAGGRASPDRSAAASRLAGRALLQGRRTSALDERSV